jgi:hypothetical protein
MHDVKLNVQNQLEETDRSRCERTRNSGDEETEAKMGYRCPYPVAARGKWHSTRASEAISPNVETRGDLSGRLGLEG